MADTQIINSQAVGVPSDYVLPGSVEFVLKAVSAEFDGSGTLGSWLPAVEIYSDSGDLIARAVDPGSAVAAAGSAEVSWFPGVKAARASAVSTLDSFAPQQCANVFSYDWAGSDWQGFALPTVDTGCIHNGYLASSGAQGDFFDMRFSLGPKGSLWLFDFLLLKGPDYGELFAYLGTPHEDAPASGEPDDVNLLSSIDASDGDFSYLLAFKISCYAAALTKNVQVSIGPTYTGHNPYSGSDFRIMGDAGDTLTTLTLPPPGNFVQGNGGPGIYALKIVAGGKVGISTGYKLGIQAIEAHRTDWQWA